MASLSTRRGGNPSAVPSRSNNQPRQIERPKLKSKTKTLRLLATGFKPQPNPYKDNGDKSEQFNFKALANASLPEALGTMFFEEWLSVNPREQRAGGPIMKAIEDTWRDNPMEFFRANRGLLIVAESVKYDSESGIVELVLSDRRKHGVVDGGHTLRKIIDELIPSTYGPPDDDESEEAGDTVDQEVEASETNDEETVIHDRYLNCEVWTGLTLDQVALLSQARNTSRTVPPYAIIEIKGEFKPLKDAINIDNPEYCNKIVAFKPNEHVEGLDEFKPVSVLDVLQLLMAMDISNSDANNHPVEAYKNKSFAAKYYAERNAEYQKMFPLIGDFLALFDTLREVVPEAYDDAASRPRGLARRWSKVLAGEGEPVDPRLVEPLYYLDPTGTKKVMRAPNAVFFPMFSAFRAYLKEENGKYAWMGGKSPTSWSKGEFHEACQRLSLKIAKSIKDKDRLNAVGRDEQVWMTCYETLNSFLFEHSYKKAKP